jgi:hypothetical protein
VVGLLLAGSFAALPHSQLMIRITALPNPLIRITARATRPLISNHGSSGGVIRIRSAGSPKVLPDSPAF